MKAKHPGIAVFDLDGTVTSKDTFLEFAKYVKGPAAFYAGLLVLSPNILLFYLKRIPNHRLKEIFFSHFFKNIPPETLKGLGEAFSTDILPKLCHKKAMDTIASHKKAGHRIVILTASSGIWLSKWCGDNGLELIGTEFETIENAYTGKLKGLNCYGIRKKEILAPILEQHDYQESFGYGDSPADKHFLGLLGNAFFGAVK